MAQSLFNFLLNLNYNNTGIYANIGLKYSILMKKNICRHLEFTLFKLH